VCGESNERELRMKASGADQSET